MDVDHDEHDDVVSRYTGDKAPTGEEVEDEEDEMPRNPLKYVAVCGFSYASIPLCFCGDKRILTMMPF